MRCWTACRWISNISKASKEAGAGHEKEPQWKIQKMALRAKFNDQPWAPRKKLSPDCIMGIRALREKHPECDASWLANYFKVSPEAVRRILKSSWVPTEGEREKQQERWRKRGSDIWGARVAQKRVSDYFADRPAKRGQSKVSGDNVHAKIPSMDKDRF